MTSITTAPAQAGTFYENAILADNPVHYWRFEETSGTTANATAGTRNGTYQGGYTLGQTSASPNLGNAVRLDGQNESFISLGTASSFSGNSISVGAWVNLDPDATNIFSIIATFENLFTLDINNNPFDPVFGQGKVNWLAGAYSVSDSAFNRGRWHYVVSSFDGVSDGGTGTLKLYIDGILQSNQITLGGDLRQSDPANIYNWYIGKATNGFAYVWDGLLDEVAIYNYALTPQQIQSHIAAAFQTDSPSVPEPSSIAGLLGLGLFGIGAAFKRKF